MMQLSDVEIARVCHEANRAYCAVIGDASQPSWADAPDWQKNSAINGVNGHRCGVISTPEQAHDAWLEQKFADGWIYGPVKDPERKTHPCCVPYDQLPEDQKAKDRLFGAIVRALTSA